MKRRHGTLLAAALLGACGGAETPTSAPDPSSPVALVVRSARWEPPVPVADAGERPFARCSRFTQSLCRLFYEQTAPAVAVNARGQAVAVWQRYEGDAFRVVASRLLPGGGWSEAERLSPEAHVRSQQVVIDGSGNAVALWFGATGGTTSYGPAGGGWGAPQDAEDSEQLVMDESGSAHMVFTRWREGLFWRRLPPGGSWTEPVLLQAEGPSSSPFITDARLAVTRGGAVHAVWVRRNQSIAGDDWDEVWSSRMPPGQAWAPPVMLAHFPRANTLAPALAAVDSGALASYRLWERAPDGRDLRRVMEQHLAGLGWTAPTAVSEPVPPPPAVEIADWPAAASDPTGTLTLAWVEVAYAPSEPTRFDLRARRFSAAQAAWSHEQLIASVRGSPYDRFGLRVAASAAGNAVAVWTQMDAPDYLLALWASVFVPGEGWSAPVALREVARMSEPSLAMDGLGNAIVMWSEPEGDRTRILSSRLVAVTAPAR